MFWHDTNCSLFPLNSAPPPAEPPCVWKQGLSEPLREVKKSPFPSLVQWAACCICGWNASSCTVALGTKGCGQQLCFIVLTRMLLTKTTQAYPSTWNRGGYECKYECRYYLMNKYSASFVFILKSLFQWTVYKRHIFLKTHDKECLTFNFNQGLRACVLAVRARAFAHACVLARARVCAYICVTSEAPPPMGSSDVLPVEDAQSAVTVGKTWKGYGLKKVDRGPTATGGKKTRGQKWPISPTNSALTRWRRSASCWRMTRNSATSCRKWTRWEDLCVVLCGFLSLSRSRSLPLSPFVVFSRRAPSGLFPRNLYILYIFMRFLWSSLCIKKKTSPVTWSIFSMTEGKNPLSRVDQPSLIGLRDILSQRSSPHTQQTTLSHTVC